MFYCEQNQLLTQKPTIAFRFLVQCIEDFKQKCEHNKIVREAGEAYKTRFSEEEDYKEPVFFK